MLLVGACVTIRAERWVRLDASRCLRARVLDDVLELQVLLDRPELGASNAALVLPLGRVRELSRALAAIAGELGVRTVSGFLPGPPPAMTAAASDFVVYGFGTFNPRSSYIGAPGGSADECRGGAR